ncbi:MAG: hypothetical protein DYG83_18335 [Candidatus Brocadia sp. AMX2]|uniref:ATPase n=1 Tax=Candidatus Brocadia sinica JPN1 TaxID=1197129 RepID=A0ABQ0K2L0_9BACT|nr:MULTISPECIES: phage/plasmid primase, P4 family [Brocadia]MBC6934190.1 hypothetical protein [Candidatus Brocadia sp.]MBL1170682.1 hypothetical protein [Candidatus Brocadia sp. AMX1]NOG42786.1 hypothetical protein [Planctomycetota bacterium]GIK12022.1 MAG: hypothetical protein BroJett002_07290 [Candidatus Brocadia sinica]KAA0240963.1 MAG: hypothetical protein EDM70_18835 [Candidatus Brocadia sp. AMX2]
MVTTIDYKQDLGYDLLKALIHGGLQNGKLDAILSLEPERFDKFALREIFFEAKDIYKQNLPITTATIIHRLGQRLQGRPLLGNIIDILLLMESERDEACLLAVNIETYLKQLREPKIEVSETVQAFNATDLGNARRLVSQHANKIRFCFAWKKWLVWDGKIWRIDNDGKILRLAKDTIRCLYEEAGEIADKYERQTLAKWAIASEAENRLRAMISLAQSEPSVPISPDRLDINPFFLNCLNGTIDLRTGQLKPHDPQDYITKIIPVEYTPDSQCSLWIEFLETIFNWNYDLIQYVQRAVGYSLTGDVTEQCLFLLHGTGSNGKSTLLSCLSMLLGDYAQTADFETFLIRKSETVRNDLARMTGKRFISAIEVEGERRLAEVLVKQLTGGDTITARFLFGEYFDFKPTFKIWLAANHKPNIKGTDYAIWRRIKLIPFNVTISEDKKDQKLLEKLKAEMSGMLTWAVQGCLQWQKNGLQTPDDVSRATNNYKAEMDAIGAFLSECCVLIPDAKVPAGKLYETYKRWCEQSGEYILSQRSFGTRLSERGFERKQSSGHWWKGIGICESTL